MSRSSPRSVVREIRGGPSFRKTVKSPSLVFSKRADISNIPSRGAVNPTICVLPDDTVRVVSTLSPEKASRSPCSRRSNLILPESPGS